jgi:hypothetical protein
MISPTKNNPSFLDALADAQLMLTAFERVGADRFDLTLTDVKAQKVQCQRYVTIDSLRKKLPNLLARSEQDCLNVIIRPRAREAIIIQLDDINSEGVASLDPYSCCVIETSEGNYQAFVAVTELVNKKEAEHVRQGLIYAVQADKGANGAARLAGSLNVKEKHRLPDGGFPRVCLKKVGFGRLFTAAELSAAGILKEVSVPILRPVPAAPRSKKRRRAPIYALSIRDTKRKKDGEIDRSGVDFLYAVTCLDWGFTLEDTVNLLQANSPKAAERKDSDYVERTVMNAEREVAARKARRPSLSLIKNEA